MALSDREKEQLFRLFQSNLANKKYLENSVGIGEHPQHLEEIDKLLEKMASAEDKLNVLQRHFDQHAKI